MRSTTTTTLGEFYIVSPGLAAPIPLVLGHQDISSQLVLITRRDAATITTMTTTTTTTTNTTRPTGHSLMFSNPHVPLPYTIVLRDASHANPTLIGDDIANPMPGMQTNDKAIAHGVLTYSESGVSIKTTTFVTDMRQIIEGQRRIDSCICPHDSPIGSNMLDSNEDDEHDTGSDAGSDDGTYTYTNSEWSNSDYEPLSFATDDSIGSNVSDSDYDSDYDSEDDSDADIGASADPIQIHANMVSASDDLDWVCETPTAVVTAPIGADVNLANTPADENAVDIESDIGSDGGSDVDSDSYTASDYSYDIEDIDASIFDVNSDSGDHSDTESQIGTDIYLLPTSGHIIEDTAASHYIAVFVTSVSMETHIGLDSGAEAHDSLPPTTSGMRADISDIVVSIPTPEIVNSDGSGTFDMFKLRHYMHASLTADMLAMQQPINVSGIDDAILLIVRTIVKVVKAAIKVVVKTAKAVAKTIRTVIRAAKKVIQATFRLGKRVLKSAFKMTAKAIRYAVRSMMRVSRSGMNRIRNGIRRQIRPMIKQIGKRVVNAFRNRASKTVTNLQNRTLRIGKNITSRLLKKARPRPKALTSGKSQPASTLRGRIRGGIR